MSKSKYIDRICIVVTILLLIITILFMNGSSLGIKVVENSMGYENRLFTNESVHTIDIVIDNWESFLSTAQSEEYSNCSVVIDGEVFKNVAIRGKGNTSLSTVASMDSDRYSFKIEFDHYDNTQNYYGLDKLSLNNIIQDNTYMKDYLVYQMMDEFGVDAPLCSYVYITVNGEDWGLYLAVEGVEDAFLQRNYGNNYGELYKPDSMSFGGGRGNGKDFDMNNFTDQQNTDNSSNSVDKNFNEDQFDNNSKDNSKTSPEGFDLNNSIDKNGESSNRMEGNGVNGSSDVKLQYIDDNPSSYSNIFDNAKTSITFADKQRLISSLKQLSNCENIDDIVNVDKVLRYFVVHNYVVNEDSYTGSMIHNYYLYEQNGMLSMIPWDYNLSFGTFIGGNASSAVNDSINEILEDRPMQSWIFSNETYTNMYYALYENMLESIDIQSIIDNAFELIKPYVEKDPTAFCSYDEFVIGVETLKEFIDLRTESVNNQLNGIDALIDVDNLDLSKMGTMSNNRGGFNEKTLQPNNSAQESEINNNTMPEDMQIPNEGQMPGNMQMPNGEQMPEDIQIPNEGQMPEDMQISNGEQMPGVSETIPSNSGLLNKSSLLLLSFSIIVLVIALIFVMKFRRRKQLY